MFTLVLVLTILLFLGVSVASLVSLFTGNEQYRVTARFLLPACIVSIVLLGIVRVMDSPESGFRDMTSSIWGFFYLFSLILVAVVIYIYFSRWGRQWASFLAVIAPFVSLLLIFSTPFINSTRRVAFDIDNTVINHVLPAHILFTMTGELFFFLSFVGSVLYLLMERSLRKRGSLGMIYRLPSLETIEKFNDWSITRSFILLTIGLIIGLLMALLHYNTFFLGTPKEIHIYFSWVVILVVFYLRSRKKLTSHRISLVNMSLFLLIMFLFIFTNIFITRGFHGFQ